MIITTTRHGRTRRDVRNLQAHLEKSVDQEARVVGIGGVALSHADDALRYMEAMRDGSRAEVAMHHVTISPTRPLDAGERDEAVRRVLAAMGAEDHPWILWEHSEKARATPDGCTQHFHLVVGHVGPDGKALDDRSSYLRLEAVARSLEVDLGEAVTHSRRSEAVAKYLRQLGRDDVAAAVMAVAPEELPRSAMTSGARAQAKRAGLDLPKAQAAVRDAWAAADGAAAFRAAMREQGFEITPGRKDGVWVVTKGGVEIGALDRIIREKRAVVAARMKEVRHDAAAPEARPEAESRGGVDLARSARRPHDEREAAAPAGAPSGRRGRGRTPGRSEGPAGADPALAEASPSESRGPAQQGRRPRPAAEAVAVHQLALVGRDERLKALAADLRAAAQPKPRRPRRAAEAVTVHGLAKVARAESLQVAREELRRAMQPALQRVSAYLDGREAKAREALEASRRPVPEPAVILQVRKQLDEARQDSQAAFYGTLEPERQAKEILEREKPKGFLAWITGRTAAWRRDRDAAEAELARIRALRAERRDAVERLEGQLRSLERAFRGQMDSERRQREREGRQARDELALIAAARACLRENPDLARQGEREVLRAARERLQREQEERIRRAQAARWQASIIEDRPAAPRVS